MSSPSDDALELAVRQLLGILYATLATCSIDGEPWCSPVYSAYDTDLDVYWCSGLAAVHSRNIRANGKAFIVFYDSTVPEGTGRGLYLRCNARELTDRAEVRHARSILTGCVDKADRPPDDYLADSPRRVYRATPLDGWVNTSEAIGGHDVDVRAPIDLAELRARVRAVQ